MHTFKVILHLYRELKEQGDFFWSGSHFYTGSTNACNYFLKYCLDMFLWVYWRDCLKGSMRGHRTIKEGMS